MLPGFNVPSYSTGGRARETVDMIVPANKAGLIIGSHGDTLRRIEKQSQVKMQFDQQWQGEDNERRIVITGFPEDIEEARRLIIEKITEEREFRKHHDSTTTIQVMLPNTRIGLVIGKGGETVKDIQERSGAKVFINPDAKVDPNTGEKPLTIIGDAEAIRLAQNIVNDIIYGGQNASGPAGRPTLVFQIPESCVGAVMGKKAEILKSIIAASGGIKIFINQANVQGTVTKDVELTGPIEYCNYAVHLIQERVNAHLAANSGDGSYSGYSGYGAATATAVDPNSYDYSQYYAAQAQQGQQTAAEMDPAAIAAYYAQYYAAAAAAGYDPQATAAAYDPQASTQQQSYDPQSTGSAYDPTKY